MKRAIIVGSGGQDGNYLFARLTGSGAAVLGITRQATQVAGSLPTLPDVIDVQDAEQIHDVIRAVAPEEIYYLAAFHHSAEDKSALGSVTLFHKSYETHVLGLVHVLEAVRQNSRKARVFYAASSHVFGHVPPSPQNEMTPLNPQCVYGITKVSGIQCCRFYRQSHGIHASVGILYNHESPRRRPDFLTKKIVRAAVAIARGQQSKLTLGDLSAKVDWGYAPDFVDAMTRILAQPTSDDYIVATGLLHTVGDFVSIAFEQVGLDWRKHVEESAGVIVKSNAAARVGDASKLRRVTGWEPSVTFEGMIKLLVGAEKNENSGSASADGGSLDPMIPFR
jgi:GDPmannose 4,6-dehydratase